MQCTEERKVQELVYPDKSVSRFVADMSEKQISARELFNVALLDELQRDFGLKKAMILIFDTDGNFLSWKKRDRGSGAGSCVFRDHAL